MTTKFCSIIMTHYGSSAERSSFMRKSLGSLIENTKYPYELIVVDNGGSVEDSKFLNDLLDSDKINTLIRNANNMHFGYARNQAKKLSHGDYICIVDNDIEYQEGWLTKCVEVLEALPGDKIYSTPMAYPTPVMRERYHRGYIEYKGEKYELSMRAGSNCFVIRREDYEEIGDFSHHRIAGSWWTDTAVRAGYLACVLPTVYATDIGLRKGYNLQEAIPIKLTLSNGHDIYFNRDEFKRDNPDKEYRA